MQVLLAKLKKLGMVGLGVALLFESDLREHRLGLTGDVGVGVHEIGRGVDVVVRAFDGGVLPCSGAR